jgi:hypothetical protein
MKAITLIFLFSLLLFSCGHPKSNQDEDAVHSRKIFIDALTKDSLKKKKSHIDSEEFVDSVMQILNEGIDPPQ